MSVYKQKGSTHYRYDFVVNGRRFFGVTEARNKKDALRIEGEMRVKARADIEQEKRTGTGPLIFDIATGRYWTEVGQYHSGSADTWRDLERLIAYFGKDKRLDEITDRDVAALVAWRRIQTIKGRKEDKDGNPVQPIAPSTVNRSTTGVLKKLFTRAKRTWRYQFPNEPNWRDHWLEEPEERVRELLGEEATALDAAAREDYEPWLQFARLTGLRRKETLIRWINVNWNTGQIRIQGKGRRWVTTPITPSVKAILDPLKGHDPEWVFTFVCRRTRGDQVKGRRYPITGDGAKSEWRRLRERAGLVDFRFHDIRHDVATKLLRETRNLKLVQQALNHRDLKTTGKYAHVLDTEVASGLQQIATPTKIPTKKSEGRG